MPEIRCELTNDEMGVIDGFVSATRSNRTDVISRILSEWSQKKLHESILVCRAAGVNPTSPETTGAECRSHRSGLAE